MSNTASGPAELVNLFEKLNQEHFAGKLSATLSWSGHMRIIAGNCDWRRGIIRLSRLYHAAYPQHLEATMLHEMLHLQLRRGHDAGFQRFYIIFA
jgi:predicted metal-dependent hydrolase